MSFQIFNSIVDITKSTVFCIIDSTNQYPTPWLVELVKNSADFEIANLTGTGYDVLVGDDEDELLRIASSGSYTHAVVTLMGTIWGDNEEFYLLLDEKVKEDWFLMGHILDKKSAYYELHPQCYVINLTQYQSLGHPDIGNRILYTDHEQLVPIRSEENYHDDYTPIWIRAGHDRKIFEHKCHGWNILRLAFENNLTVLTFTEDFRNSKRYFYPDDDDSVKHQSKFYLETTVASRHWINPFGTSRLPCNTLQGPLKNLVTTCNGLDWIFYLKNYGFEHGTKVKFVDYNMMFLEFTKRLLSWDGVDYIKFLNEFGQEKTEFLGLPNDTWYGIKYGLEERWHEFKETVDWESTWAEIKQKVTFEFCYKDFLHEEVGHNWIDSTYNNQRTLINLSHVFSYHSTAIFYTLLYRLQLENKTIDQLKNTVPNAWVMFDQRAYKGFKSYDTQSKFSQARNFNTVDIKELITPLWHNNDW
jgi:hypothetical protein